MAMANQADVLEEQFRWVVTGPTWLWKGKQPTPGRRQNRVWRLHIIRLYGDTLFPGENPRSAFGMNGSIDCLIMVSNCLGENTNFLQKSAIYWKHEFLGKEKLFLKSKSQRRKGGVIGKRTVFIFKTQFHSSSYRLIW